jgi:hypothetical protein
MADAGQQRSDAQHHLRSDVRHHLRSGGQHHQHRLVSFVFDIVRVSTAEDYIYRSAQMNIFDQMSGIIFNRVFSCFDQVPSFDQVVSFDQVIPFLYLVLGLIIGYYFGRQTPSGSGSDSLRRFCETTITEPVVPAPAVKPVVTAPAVKANRGRERRRLAWENAPNEVCRKWEAGECRDGKNCRRIHERRQ